MDIFTIMNLNEILLKIHFHQMSNNNDDNEQKKKNKIEFLPEMLAGISRM